MAAPPSLVTWGTTTSSCGCQQLPRGIRPGAHPPWVRLRLRCWENGRWATGKTAKEDRESSGKSGRK
nr:unnamed protein product [Digitaria exilis]